MLRPTRLDGASLTVSWLGGGALVLGGAAPVIASER